MKENMKIFSFNHRHGGQ